MRVENARWNRIIWIALACLTASGQLAAQSQNPLPPPPSLLAPPPAGGLDCDDCLNDSLDPYAAPLGDNSKLNLFHTRSIPFASWSETEWPEDILASTTIKRFRTAFYQRTQIGAGWIAPSGDLGQSYFRSSVALTVGKPSNILIVVPSFEIDFLDGPTALDVPGRLYSVYTNLIWRRSWNERVDSLVGVRPGYFSDFSDSDVRGERLSGFATVSWEVFPEKLTVYAGVVYLGREDTDTNLIPALGAVWTPNGDFRADLLFPKPKVSWRLGHVPYVSEDWVYIAGQLGGGTFEVERTSGAIDDLSLRDFRLSLGVERIIEGGTGWYVEAGLVFRRQIEYRISGEELDLSDSFGVEAGFSF